MPTMRAMRAPKALGQGLMTQRHHRVRWRGRMGFVRKKFAQRVNWTFAG